MPDGNYYPNPASPVSSPRCANGFWTQGSGPPTCGGFTGQLYIDLDSGDTYKFIGGAWVKQLVGVGGVGGGQVFIDYAPSTPPNDPTKAALSYPSGGGTLSNWDIDSQTWV